MLNITVQKKFYIHLSLSRLESKSRFPTHLVMEVIFSYQVSYILIRCPSHMLYLQTRKSFFKYLAASLNINFTFIYYKPRNVLRNNQCDLCVIQTFFNMFFFKFYFKEIRYGAIDLL